MINEKIEIWKKLCEHILPVKAPIEKSWHDLYAQCTVFYLPPYGSAVVQSQLYIHRKRTCRQWNSMVQGTMYSFWNIRLIS